MTRDALTPVATIVLSTLAEGPSHPYEILATLRRRADDRLVRLSPGAVYHAVDKLGALGLVETVGTDRGGNRPERTTYAITAPGRQALVQRVRELVADLAPEYPRFPVGLSMLDELDPATVADLLRTRRDATEARRADLDARYRTARERGVPRRFMLDAEHEIHMARAETAWLDALLTELGNGSPSWTEELPARRPPGTAAGTAPARRTEPLPDPGPHDSQETS
ncbi:PadR family transcriptional regulator [Sediminihabitans luteus]|uniref:PadR family transcriptional regulator n=1 Tax=Sediminihabitans luteus TaxID=1138585 RepID=A0A2M9CYN4_9CELL|nr:PadR family transcriptional regulator [Sediminihabitans luteus]PJJ77051.1 PadR family transcriptional regulator [Sediminihabitans luteus]GIJ00430.1 PadR family transcriptional regulator [Sediminihabitans luteus]